jgi:hypothetical protein
MFNVENSLKGGNPAEDYPRQNLTKILMGIMDWIYPGKEDYFHNQIKSNSFAAHSFVTLIGNLEFNKIISYKMKTILQGLI